MRNHADNPVYEIADFEKAVILIAIRSFQNPLCSLIVIAKML